MYRGGKDELVVQKKNGDDDDDEKNSTYCWFEVNKRKRNSIFVALDRTFLLKPNQTHAF